MDAALSRAAAREGRTVRWHRCETVLSEPVRRSTIRHTAETTLFFLSAQRVALAHALSLTCCLLFAAPHATADEV